MSRVIARSNPVAFKTQAIRVKASPQGLDYHPEGAPLSFAEMQELRRPVWLEDPWQFEVLTANLGVSLRIDLHWRGRDYLLLIRQQRDDMGDCVLKLVSGYVPAHQLRVPLLCAITEVAEELLFETEAGWLPGRYQNVWLPTPYADSLTYCDSPSFELQPHSCFHLPVSCAGMPLLERPRAYLHQPTNSLQLVYHLDLVLPDQHNLRQALHTDEKLDDQGELVARIDPQQPELFLLAMDSGQLMQIRESALQPVELPEPLLSEAFCRQTGWLVSDSHCPWSQANLQQR